MSKRKWLAILGSAGLVFIAIITLFESPAIPVQPDNPRQSTLERTFRGTELSQEGDAPTRAIRTTETLRASNLYAAVDHAGLPLEGVTVATYASNHEERAFALNPRTVIGVTGEYGELSVTKPERSALDARFFAFRADIGTVPFLKAVNGWLAQYPLLGELTIQCRGLDGVKLSGISVVMSSRVPIAKRFLMTAASEQALISPTEDPKQRIYKGVSGPYGIIRMKAPAGHYVVLFISPYMALHSGIMPYEGVSIPGPVYEVVLSPMYATIASLPRSKVLSIESSPPPKLAAHNSNAIDSVTHARALLTKKFPGAYLDVYAPKDLPDEEDLEQKIRIYWEHAGWHTHNLDIVRLTADVEAQELTPPPSVQRENEPEQAELIVTLVDQRGNVIPKVSIQARFVDDDNLPENQRGPPELRSPPLRRFQSGTPKQLRPGNYSLSSRSDVLSRSLAGARVTLGVGERKTLEFEANEITRPCRLVIERGEDHGVLWVNIENSQGQQVTSYGAGGSRHPVRPLPLGAAKLTIRIMGRLVLERTIDVIYDPQYSVQEIKIPSEAFTR